MESITARVALISQQPISSDVFNVSIGGFTVRLNEDIDVYLDWNTISYVIGFNEFNHLIVSIRLSGFNWDVYKKSPMGCLIDPKKIPNYPVDEFYYDITDRDGKIVEMVFLSFSIEGKAFPMENLIACSHNNHCG